MKTNICDQDDELLVERLKTGDREAFRTLVLRHGARYRALAYRFTGDMSMAEDLVQEAFVKLWTNAKQFDGDRARFTTWFHRVVVNRCLDEKRKRQVEALPEGFDRADSSPTADTLLEQDSVSNKLAEALNQLSERQRTAMTLSYYDELSNQEAAEMMEMHIKAYESLLVRARSKLRDILTAESANMMSAFG